MGTPANLKDVAAAAGVSVSTASRALAGKTVIAEETRKKVAQAAAKLNYAPNIQARSLRTAKTSTIGLAIPSLVNPFFATMAAAIQESANEHGFSTLITSYDEDTAALNSALGTLNQYQVDGMIVVPGTDTDEAQLSAVSHGLPTVLIDRQVEGSRLPAVVSEAQPGIDQALAHLVSMGHEKVGFLAGPGGLSTGAGRLAAFRASREKHPSLLAHPEYIHHGGFAVNQGKEGTRSLLEHGVTAIIAGDSMMTLGAMEYCHGQGVGIGQDLALVGFDDLVYMRVQPCPVSVIDQDVVEMGHKALTILLEWMEGHSPPPRGTSVIPTRFIPRASTQFPPTPQRR